MSGPLRQLIGPTKARLLRYFDEVNTIFERNVEDGEDTEDIDIRVSQLVHLSSRIQKGCRLLERRNNDWANILKDLQDDDRTAEEQIYASVAEGETGFIAVLLDCYDMEVKIETQLSRLDSLKKQHIAKVELEPAPRLGEKDPNFVQVEAIQAIREAIEAMAHDQRRERPNLLLYRNSNYRHLMEMFSIGRNSGTCFNHRLTRKSFYLSLSH